MILSMWEIGDEADEDQKLLRDEMKRFDLPNSCADVKVMLLHTFIYTAT
jgi:hypothetical protein